MTRFNLRKFNNYLGFLVLFILLVSCETSEYDRTVLEEMDKGIQLDGLKFGLAFGDTHQEFYDKCTELNKQHLITVGDVKHFAVHQLHDPKINRTMKYYFYGKFLKDKDLMVGLDMQFSYEGWGPWADDLQSDKLILAVMDTLQKWYPGNAFKRLDNPKLKEPLYYKIDGNRQIILHTEGPRDVVGIIEDLNTKIN